VRWNEDVCLQLLNNPTVYLLCLVELFRLIVVVQSVWGLLIENRASPGQVAASTPLAVALPSLAGFGKSYPGYSRFAADVALTRIIHCPDFFCLVCSAAYANVTSSKFLQENMVYETWRVSVLDCGNNHYDGDDLNRVL
jgi:hypothetical protein